MKEYCAIDYIDVSSQEPHYIAVTAGSKVSNHLFNVINKLKVYCYILLYHISLLIKFRVS